jgi:hypothetical protein
MAPLAPPIPRRYWWIALAIVALAAAGLLAMGRPPICTCGTVKLWVGTVTGPDNSQHIADWYTPSHIVHGFLFYALGWWALRRNHVQVSSAPHCSATSGGRGDLDIGDRLIAAVLIESAWELLENSPFIIDRYRHETMALGYTGDSVLNSVCDIGWMVVGFALARRLPIPVTIALAVGLELLCLIVIRDNLTLNVLMLIAPNDAIRAWQAGG